MPSLGLIAGSGHFPLMVARAASHRGLDVHAVAHEYEADASLELLVRSLVWVKVGQVSRIVRHLRSRGVDRAVMAGGIGRVRSLTEARPDWGALRIAASLRSFRDDEMLRGAAEYFERHGIQIVSPTDFVPEVLVEAGHLAGPSLSPRQRRDVEMGREVARALGTVDVGQTVVVKNGAVLAVEAVEGTDEAIRRGGRLGGPGAVVIKSAKPGQDVRFDLPAVGPTTLEIMREVRASVLALEAGKTVLLEREAFVKWAARLGIAVLAE
jgi:DUF1009 family protein